MNPQAARTGPGATAQASEAGSVLFGGHPVLDFINAVAWRTDHTRRTERVGTAQEWARWAGPAGALSAPAAQAMADALPAEDPADLDSSLARLRLLRTTVSQILDALVDGVPPPPTAWRALRQYLLAAHRAAELPPVLPLRWEPRADRFADLVHALALQTEELLSAPLAERIRRCQGTGCGWFFLDRSRNGTRRWCSSGDCGNRARARRHYHRSRS